MAVPHARTSRVQRSSWREDDVGEVGERNGTLQRLHTSWVLYPSEQRLKKLGDLPGERRAVLRPCQLQQTVLCQGGESVCSVATSRSSVINL